MSAANVSSSSLSAQLKLIPFHSLSSFITSKSIAFRPKKDNVEIPHIDCAAREGKPVKALNESWKWRTRISFFPSFLTKSKDVDSLKQELLEAIAPLDRGAEATPEDQERVDQIARKLEAANKVKEPLKSDLLNGKWELLYTTSQSILQTQRPKFLRPSGKIYQSINVDTLRAQNMETWPFFNQATANLVPLNAKRVAVKFDSFKIAGVIPIKSSGSGRGQLEITYLDEELRISRGNQGNLFILRMADPSYRVPL